MLKHVATTLKPIAWMIMVTSKNICFRIVPPGVQMGRAGPFSDDQLESPQGYSYRDQPPRRPSRDGTGDRCARARPLSAGRVRSATTAPAPERPER